MLFCEYGIKKLPGRVNGGGNRLGWAPLKKWVFLRIVEGMDKRWVGACAGSTSLSPVKTTLNTLTQQNLCR
jgi:hypothetical protein